ncbi:MAG: carbon-nitrogen hydrolase family protein [Candidatus Altiarchaeota archaeon]
MVKDKVKVALCQLKSSGGEEGGVARIVESIRRAGKRGCDIVCFSESLMGGIIPVNSAKVKSIQEACGLAGVWCILTENFMEKGRVHKMALLIGRDGKIKGRYRKVFLCGDHRLVEPGRKFPVFETDFGKIGIAICWDVSFSRPFVSMVRRGAKIIFCPMLWQAETWIHRTRFREIERRLLESILLARASENLVYMAFVNEYDPGLDDLIPFTAVADPHRIIRQLYGREGTIYINLDLRELQKIRRKYKALYEKEVHSL